MVRIPNLKDPAVAEVLVNMVKENDIQKKDMLSAVTGNRALLLYSPSKKVFEVKVSDTGVLSVVQVAG